MLNLFNGLRHKSALNSAPGPSGSGESGEIPGSEGPANEDPQPAGHRFLTLKPLYYNKLSNINKQYGNLFISYFN